MARLSLSDTCGCSEKSKRSEEGSCCSEKGCSIEKIKKRVKLSFLVLLEVQKDTLEVQEEFPFLLTHFAFFKESDQPISY